MSNEQNFRERLAAALSLAADERVDVAALAKAATVPGTVGESGADPQAQRGIYTRAKQAITYFISGVTPQTWFTPNQPLLPISQESGGRQWDYPVGYNLRTTPRANEPIGFTELRALAESYDLLRLLIETRKDQLAKIKWAVVPVDPKKADDMDNDPRVAELESFLRMPDRRHTWQQWLRMVLEEMLVIDAATVFPRFTRGGKPYSLDLIDGATVNPKIDAFGRPPEPPSVAYQQIIKGVPAADFTLDQLIYAPRNKRVSKVYGYSPVEQITMTVSIALRRQIFQLQYYTEGSIPDLIMTTPEGWTPGQIREFDTNWNVMLRGDTAARRGVKWVPHGTESINTKEAALKDEYDEWLARVVCFAFSVNPQPFVKQMNRATAETAQDAAMQEGLVPLMQWVEDLMNMVIWRYFGYIDLRFGWQDEQEQDPEVQAKIDDMNVKNGTSSVDEIRSRRGDEPIGMGPAVYTQNGPILLADVIAGTVGPAADMQQAKDSAQALAEAKAQADADRQDNGPAASPDGDGTTSDKDKGNAKAQAKQNSGKKPGKADGDEGQSLAQKLAKARKPAALPYDSPEQLDAVAAMQRGVAKRLKAIGAEYAEQLGEAFETGAYLSDAVGKAASWAGEDPDEVAQRLVDSVQAKGWGELGDYSQPALEQAVGRGGLQALANVGVGSDDDHAMLSQVDGRAVDYAMQRSAEMVGMVRGANGELTPNPNPAYAISDATRGLLRSTVAQAVQEGWSSGQLKAAVQDDYAFGKARAGVIAKTELNNAFAAGNMAGYQASGVVKGKRWVLGDLHGQMDPCDENARDGVIPIGEPFSSGHMQPTAHPGCVCTLLPVFELPEE